MRRVVALCLALAAGAVAPAGAADDADSGAVVLTVGKSTMTVGEIERRLRAIPSFQITTLGSSPEEIRKTFVEKVLVPELLYYEEAKRRNVEKELIVADRIRDVLRKTMEQEIRDTQSEVTADEVKAYYDENRHRFSTPRRIKLWRILVKDESLAKKIIAEVKVDPQKGVRIWHDRSRKDSVDKATNMRDGDLGFVSPDGQTELPQVRVNPALFAAADKVKDGEIVPDPVKEDDGFSVVWRRGSLSAVDRTLAQEAPSIRAILARSKVRDSVNDLVKKLEGDKVKNVAPELLSYVAVDQNGDIGTRQKPGVIPRHRARGSSAPKRENGMLR